MKKLLILLIFSSLASCHLAECQTINHWKTAVFNNDTWKYFVGITEPDPNWRSLSFIDDYWLQGAGGFGYSDNDDNTIIPQCTSVFIRVIFNMPDTALIAKSLLSMDYDDAFVAYINDIEIARSGISGIHPAFNQTGLDHEAKMYSGGVPESFTIGKIALKKILVPGKNVLAIQVHNSSPTSSDLSSNAFLSFGIVNPTNVFRPVPLWFISPFEFISSNLPIILINTDGVVNIPDSPRVLANMKIIYRGEGLRNYLTDQNTSEFLNYNGRISIEIRGSSSQILPKKQYGLTTLKSDNITNNNISIMGFPDDNDWILNGMGFEPALVRDYLNYNLSRMIGEYASRTRYCEVFINGNYNGLYVLQEKIKQGSGRVNVTKIETKDVNFPAVTGGYITKADKTTGGDPVAWKMSSFLGFNDVSFIHDMPKPEDVRPEQNNYIRSQFEKLSSTASYGNNSLDYGYPSVIDIPSFVDYMIINELSANADAYQYSTFFHKDRNGKLRAGPIWDLNTTYGYDLAIWGFDRSKTDTWQFSNGNNEGALFWRDLFKNTSFKCYFSKRWNQLTQPGQPLSLLSIESFIDQTVATISEAVIRENTRWGTVPNHSTEINKIKDFLKKRIDWITSNIGPFSDCSNVEVPSLVITKIMYNPDSTFHFQISNDQEFIEIKNTGDKTVDLTGVYFSSMGLVYQFPLYSEMFPNTTKILASNALVFRSKYGFLPSGQFTRNLSNNGENLVLSDGFGNVIDNVHYSNKPPWPDADGNGYFLELTDPSLDNNIPENWTSSASVLVSVKDDVHEYIPALYPNPVKDNLTIESSFRIILLQLYNFQGDLIRKIKVDSGTYILDMKEYLPGIYLLEIITSEGTSVHKIFKE